MTSTPLPIPMLGRCSLPPWALASREFQDDPWPIEIAGTRQAEGDLFDLLDRIDDPEGRGAAFHEYMAFRFQIDKWGTAPPMPSENPRQGYYLPFLRGWSADSNGRSGAVLKSWVESRFGLKPTYHSGILAEDATAREKYIRDKSGTEAMGIIAQLDLVYTFCQYELARRLPGERWMTLYRGTHDPEEYAVKREGTGDKSLVELNNLSSFTSDNEIAWEFGSSVWEVRIPLPKIVFFGRLLPQHFPDSEKEHLVLGGEYRVKKLRW